MGKKAQKVKEACIWVVILVAVLKSFGFPVNKEIIPLTEVITQAAEQLSELETEDEEKLELLHDFKKEELEMEQEAEYELESK